MSLMTHEEPEEGDWLIEFRLQKEDTGPIGKELKSSGFNVTYVG